MRVALYAAHDRLIDALDQIVALLVELVDAPLGCSYRMIVRHARPVFFMPQLDVDLAKLRYERSDCVHVVNLGASFRLRVMAQAALPPAPPATVLIRDRSANGSARA